MLLFFRIILGLQLKPQLTLKSMLYRKFSNLFIILFTCYYYYYSDFLHIFILLLLLLYIIIYITFFARDLTTLDFLLK